MKLIVLRHEKKRDLASREISPTGKANMRRHRAARHIPLRRDHSDVERHSHEGGTRRPSRVIVRNTTGLPPSSDSIEKRWQASSVQL